MPPTIPPPAEIRARLWNNFLAYAQKHERAARLAGWGALAIFILGLSLFYFSIKFNPNDIESLLFGSPAMQSIEQTLDDVTKDIGHQYKQIKTHVQVGHAWINASSSAPTPTIPYLNGLHISRTPSDENTTTKLFKAWAVGSQGTILHSSDGGKRWLQQDPHTFQFLNGIIFAPDPSHGWAVGSAFGTVGTIICTDNGGGKWKSSTLRTYSHPDTSRDSNGLRDSECKEKTIDDEDDDTASCTLKRGVIQHLNAITYEPHNESRVWAVGSGFEATGPAIWHGSVNGEDCAKTEWQLKKIKGLKQISCHQPVHLNAIGFHPQTDGYDDEGYAVGSHLTVINIKKSGSEYTLEPELSVRNFTDEKKACDYPDLRGVHVGQRYNPSVVPNGVNVWAVGDRGIILAADARKPSTGWYRQLSPTAETLYAVDFTRDNIRGVAVGDAGTILMTDNSGETWSPVSGNEIHDNLRDVRIFEPGAEENPANCQDCIHSIWAVGTHGAIYYSPNILEQDKERMLDNGKGKAPKILESLYYSPNILEQDKERMLDNGKTLESLLNQGTSKFDDNHTKNDLDVVITKLRGVMGDPTLRRDIEQLSDIRARIDELLNLKHAVNEMPHHISSSIYRENTVIGMLLAFGLPLMVFLTTVGMCGMLLNIYSTNTKLAAFYRARADALLATTAMGKTDYDTFDKFADVLSPRERDISGDGAWLERIGDLTSRIFGGKKTDIRKESE